MTKEESYIQGKCELYTNTSKYNYENIYTKENPLITNGFLFQYKTYDELYDEYIYFISALDYKKVNQIITTSIEEKNIVCSYRVSGKYDFIVKSFYPHNVFPEFNYPDIINEIQICKVIDRYVPKEHNLNNVFNTTNVFLNADVNLSRISLFADFIEIKSSNNNHLSDDLINALETSDNPENDDNLKFIYVIYKLENITTKVHTWLICLRYKCHEYRKRYLNQMMLDNFVDAKEHIKTTYISNSSNIRKKNIIAMFENMRYESIIGKVLYANAIRKQICNIHKDLVNAQDMNIYLDKLCTNHEIFYNDLLKTVRNYKFYISYKQSNHSKELDDSNEICNILNYWFEINKFENVYIDKRCIKINQELEEYMQDLGKTNLLIVCLSKKYFESINCMYELSLFFKNNKRNNIDKKIIFVASRFLLNQNEITNIKDMWQNKPPSPSNNKERKRIQIIQRQIENLENISDRLHVILKEDNSKILHYEKAIEAILTNIVEKILKE